MTASFFFFSVSSLYIAAISRFCGLFPALKLLWLLLPFVRRQGLEIIVGDFQAFFSAHFWLPAQDLSGFGNIRLALLGIVHRQRFIHNFLGGSCQKNYLFSTIPERNFIRIPNINRHMIIAQQKSIYPLDKVRS